MVAGSEGKLGGSPHSAIKWGVSLFAETLQSPITVEPAAITEYRRRLMGKTPEEALAIYKKLIGSIWNSQCEPVRQIRNLSNADQILAAVTEAPLFSQSWNIR